MKSQVTRPKPAMRERIADHERPRAVLKGPPVTVTCACGERRGVEYGGVWDCTCGRRWDTSQINPHEYARLRRLQVRFRAVPVILGLATSGLALYFLLTGNSFSMFFLLPLALIVWGMIVRPVLRRRYSKALGTLPQWNLYSEPSGSAPTARTHGTSGEKS